MVRLCKERHLRLKCLHMPKRCSGMTVNVHLRAEKMLCQCCVLHALFGTGDIYIDCRESR